MSRNMFLIVAAGCAACGGCLAPAKRADLAAMPGRPGHLRCEYLVDPLGIDSASPRLSWEMNDTRRGAMQQAYQILVADRPELLDSDVGNLWDSGRVASDQSNQVAYAGAPLRSRLRAWWKVRIWDREGRASPWSESARWSMGLLQPQDWAAKWIGDAAPPPPVTPAHNGYHSELASSADAAKWVAIDLGEPTRVSAVRLFPARPIDWTRDTPGFLFPLRFRVEASDAADFARPTVLVDQTSQDVANPADQPQTYRFAPVTCRHVRLVVTRLAMRNQGQYGFSLAELQVLRGDENVAMGKPVAAFDSVEHHHWSARRLVDGDTVSHPIRGMDALPAPTLRKAFDVPAGSRVERATVYVTALGLYELHINGQRVGDHLLAPEWTDYHKRVQYQTYDVTGLVRAGRNAIAAMLGDGWYAGRIGLAADQADGRIRALYGRQPRLLLRLEIERAGGATQAVVSDESWRSTTDGPIRAGDLLDGETYDARRDMPGWDAPGFDDSSWRAVAAGDPFALAGEPAGRAAKLVAQPSQPIRVVRELRPVKLTEPRPGVFVFDLGQNMAGWCRLSVRGEAGTTVTLRHAEVLNPDGTIYTANLRSAAQTDRYTLRGGGPETFEPHFTYHGFRYVEATGLKRRPRRDALVGRVFHSALPETGRFECSSPMLNRLMANIVWTQRANTMGIPTDCPQRDERLGWMGDILAFAQTACFNMDMAAFFTKWLPDVRDAQADDGRYPDFAPHPFNPNARCSGVPAWGDAGIVVPWCAYVNYGDRRVLEQQFESARRAVEFVRSSNPGLCWVERRGNDYGDWLNADTLQLAGWPRGGAEVPKDVFATMFFYHSTDLLAKMAAVLGRSDDQRRYAQLAQDIRAAFLKAYVAPDGRMKGNTQAGYAIALHFGLIPESLRPAAAGFMREAFATYRGHISTGFHSTICLMQELTRNGRADEAYRLLHNRTMPSWGYAIDHGATTIWERWDGYVEGRGFQDPGMNSFSHYAIGSVGEWMYRCIAGINPDESRPGYQHIIIHPYPGGGLKWAGAEYDSMYGRIASRWKRRGNRLALDVSIPANTSATVFVPAADAAYVTESGQLASRAAGVQFVRMEDGAAVYEVGAGRYHFEARVAGDDRALASAKER